MSVYSCRARSFFLLSLACSAFMLSCASGSAEAAGKGPAVAVSPGSGLAASVPGSVRLQVAPGKRWTMRSLFMKHTPSFAGWIETTSGEYVRTLLVSAKAGAGGWFGAPEGGRPESLPVWYHASAVSSAAPVLDAVSAASSDDGATAQAGAESLETGREYVVFLEINHSFDYNPVWAKGGKPGDSRWNGVNGQPSLVYSARFVAGRPETIVLSPYGHGSVDGSNGDIEHSLDGMTTALEITEKILLEVM